jgi:hypothetical protein
MEGDLANAQRGQQILGAGFLPLPPAGWPHKCAHSQFWMPIRLDKHLHALA